MRSYGSVRCLLYVQVDVDQLWRSTHPAIEVHHNVMQYNWIAFDLAFVTLAGGPQNLLYLDTC